MSKAICDRDKLIEYLTKTIEQNRSIRVNTPGWEEPYESNLAYRLIQYLEHGHFKP